MKRILLSFTLLLTLPMSASPFTVPELKGYVNDFGGMISSSVEAELTARLKAFEESDSTQLVILTVPSLEGEPIEDYGIKVAEAWKIGKKGKDNGILFIVSKQEKKMRIEVGRGLEGRLTDLMAGRIIDLVVKPIFQQGNYDEGFKAGVASLIDATRGEFKAKETPSSGRTGSPDVDPLLLAIFAISIIVIAFMVSRSARGGRRGGHLAGWSSGGDRSGGGWFSGGGGYSGSGLGGGFSGGGGGSFGGGGASGSW